MIVGRRMVNVLNTLGQDGNLSSGSALVTITLSDDDGK